MTCCLSNTVPTVDVLTIAPSAQRRVTRGVDASLVWGLTEQGSGRGTSASLTSAALIGDRYRPLRLLAAGGAGRVYEAEHVHTGARVALKVMDDRDETRGMLDARCYAEARIAAAIESEHVVTVTDAGTVDALDLRRFLVMELLQGRTLEDEASAPMAPDEVVDVLRQVADGVQKAHAVGVVHCDLKPENIFVVHRADGSRLVKVLDFGIAKQMSGGPASERHAVMGTPHYMSPEQARGDRAAVDERTDTWAIGLIAFRLLAGKPYFSSQELTGVLTALLFDPMGAPSELGCPISEAFDAWFMRSCSREMSERYRSPTEQVHALANALGVSPRHAAAEPMRSLAVVRSRRRARAETRRAGGGRQSLLAGLLAAAVLLGWSVPLHSRGQDNHIVAAGPVGQPGVRRMGEERDGEREPVVEPWVGAATASAIGMLNPASDSHDAPR